MTDAGTNTDNVNMQDQHTIKYGHIKEACKTNGQIKLSIKTHNDYMI